MYLRKSYFIIILISSSICFGQDLNIKVPSREVLNKEIIQKDLLKYRVKVDSIIKVNESNANAYRISALIDIIQFRFDGIKNKLEKAIKIDSFNKNSKGLAENYNILGRYYKDIQKNDSALFYFEKAFTLSKSNPKFGGRYMYDIYGMYAIRNQNDSAMIAIKKGLILSLRAKDTFNLLRLKGEENNLLKKPGESDLKSAIALRNYGHKTNNKHIIALAHNKLGYYYQNTIDSLLFARKYLDSAITFYREQKNLFLLNSTYPSRAYVASKDTLSEKKPIDFYELQYGIVKNTGHIYEGMAIVNLAQSYYKIGRKKEAEKLTRKVIELSKIQEIQKILVAIAYENLSIQYENDGDFESALEYRKESYKNEMATYSTTIADQANKYKIQFESQQKEKENLQLRAETAEKETVIAQKTRRNWQLGIGLGFALIILSSFFYVNKHRQQKQKIAQELKDVQQQEEKRIEIDIAKTKEQERIAFRLHRKEVKALETIVAKLEQTNNQALIDRIVAVKESVRQLAYQLQPYPFAKSSFKDQVLNLFADDRLANLEVFQTGLKSIDWSKISDGIKRNLIIVLEENISNIYNHSNATKVDFSFDQNGNTLLMTIKDNGKGFDLKEINEGIGLQDIRLKINEMNGTVTIESEPRQGTRILFNILLT